MGSLGNKHIWYFWFYWVLWLVVKFRLLLKVDIICFLVLDSFQPVLVCLKIFLALLIYFFKNWWWNVPWWMGSDKKVSATKRHSFIYEYLGWNRREIFVDRSCAINTIEALTQLNCAPNPLNSELFISCLNMWFLSSSVVWRLKCSNHYILEV